MTIVMIPGQYYDSLESFGHLPGGPRGSLAGAGVGIATKLAYRGAKYVARRFFKPKRYTYIGATGRGVAIGTGIASFLNGEEDSLDGPVPERPGKTPNRFQQRNRGRGSVHRCRRRNNRYRPCNVC